jgi:tetratricopeptide (TPR) repeat protein
MIALTGRALSLYFKEDYEGLLMALDRALALEPNNVWGLNFKGNVLSEFAYYEDAAHLFGRAVSLDSSNHDSFLSMGWALENLRRLAEARQAYETAISLQENDLWAHKGLANALVLLGETKAGIDKYRYVIEQAKKRKLVSADDKSLIGWCRYNLGQYKDAGRIFEEALALNRKMLSTWFDLALVQMCGEDYSLSLHNYQRTLEMVDRKHVFKRRGLLYIAMDDLKQAATTQPRLFAVKEFQQVMSWLEMAWEQVENVVIKHSVLA